MSDAERDENRGPGWWTIGDFMLHLQAEYGVHVEWTAVATKSQGKRLYVRVQAWRVDDEGARVCNEWAGGDWPTAQHKTMPGMLYRLCHSVEQQLAASRAAERRKETGAELPLLAAIANA